MASIKRIDVYDTTLRDGTQGLGVNFSLADKLDLVSMLDDFGVDYIEGGYPLSNPKDAEFFSEVKKISLANSKIAAFGMTRRKGVSAKDDSGMLALLDCEAPVITIVGKTWDMQVSEVLGVDKEENLAMISDSVEIMAERDREVIYDAEHFFDGYLANSQYAIATLKAAFDAGASCLCLCDTNGGCTMQQIGEIVRNVIPEFGDAKFGIHCHNDSGLAVANTLIAVSNGVTHVQGTINGIGERSGNADLTTVIANLLLKYECDALLPGSLVRLTRISRYFYEKGNSNIPPSQPFVGPGAFAHKGGMHVHAVLRKASAYEHVNPDDVGNSRRILVSELSGVSNIAATLPVEFNISNDKKMQKKILDRISELENEGYEFEVAGASMNMLIRKMLGGEWYSPFWKLDHYR